MGRVKTAKENGTVAAHGREARAGWHTSRHCTFPTLYLDSSPSSISGLMLQRQTSAKGCRQREHAVPEQITARATLDQNTSLASGCRRRPYPSGDVAASTTEPKSMLLRRTGLPPTFDPPFFLLSTPSCSTSTHSRVYRTTRLHSPICRGHTDTTPPAPPPATTHALPRARARSMALQARTAVNAVTT